MSLDDQPRTDTRALRRVAPQMAEAAARGLEDAERRISQSLDLLACSGLMLDAAILKRLQNAQEALLFAAADIDCVIGDAP